MLGNVIISSADINQNYSQLHCSTRSYHQRALIHFIMQLNQDFTISLTTAITCRMSTPSFE